MFYTELAFGSFKLCIRHPTFILCEMLAANYNRTSFVRRTFGLALLMGGTIVGVVYERSRSQHDVLVFAPAAR
jgi:hypothetical protein